MKKNQFPILEYDPTQIAFIEPRIKTDVIAPKRLVICFFKEVIAHLLSEKQIIPLIVLPSEMLDVIVYKFIDSDCCITLGLLGGPASGGFLENFIALGINKVMSCGGAGVLQKDLTFGKFVVVEKAIRDEGLSYHYLEPSREVFANPTVIKAIQFFLENKQIDYVMGKTWTTDAFYRETKDKIDLRKEEGCLVVEMEQASLLAVAQFRQIDYGAILYGGDDLTKEQWDSRNWRTRQDIREELTQLCKEIVMTI